MSNNSLKSNAMNSNKQICHSLICYPLTDLMAIFVVFRRVCWDWKKTHRKSISQCLLSSSIRQSLAEY